MELFLWLAVIFAFSLIVGILLEKIRIPWLFAPLFLGLITNAMGMHPSHASNFEFVANLGMYFMLFIIGFKLDLEEFKKLGKEIVKDTMIINITCSLIGMTIVMALGYPILVSLIAGIAMSTVGEAVLVPILEEFKLIRTKLGTMMIGIGVFDDIFEVTAIILAGTLVVSAAETLNVWSMFAGIVVPAILTIGFFYVRGLKALTRRAPVVEDLVLIGLSVFFIYMAIGGLAGAEGMGAILAGISLKNLVANKDLKKTEFAFEMMIYGFFAPLFFTWVGMTVDLKSLILFPILTITLYLGASIAKVFVSWLVTRGVLGSKRAFVLGLALSVRFSTELVIAQFLFASHVISSALFTAIVVSSAMATLINPFLMIGALRRINPKKLSLSKI